MTSRRRAIAPLWTAVHLIVLANFAFAQPLYDLFGRHAEFLVAHHTRTRDLLLLVALLSAGLPALIALPAATAVRFAPRAGGTLADAAVAGLAALAALPVLRRAAGVPEAAQLAAAAAGGLTAALLYRRWVFPGAVLTALSPAILLFPALFLLSPSIRPIALPTAIRSAPPLAVEATTPVVMVIFDELSLPTMLTPEGRIDAARFPSFAALAGRAHWFRRATTVADSTAYAVPAILTGAYPESHRLPIHRAYPNNLFSALAGSYRLEVVETITDLCPERLCPDDPFTNGAPAGRGRQLLADIATVYPHVVLPAGLRRRLPPITDHWKGFREEAASADQERLFRAFLETVRRGEDRTVYFLHSLLPHRPWNTLPSGRRYHCGRLPAIGREGGHWLPDDWVRAQAFQRYLAQAVFADRLLGELLATLGRNGLDRRALLVVTADHGMSFQEGRHQRLIAPDNIRGLASIPLFVRLPGQRTGTIDDRAAQTIDILPTVLEALGAGELPWQLDGRSLFDPGPDRERLTVFKSARSLGSRFELRPAALHAADEGIAELLGRFGPGVDGLFEMAPFGPLLGRPIAEVATLPAAVARAVLDPAARHWTGDYQACRTGYVERTSAPRGGPASDAPLHVALVVDGTVRAVTRTFAYGGQNDRFLALLGDDSSLAGRPVTVVVLAPGAVPPWPARSR